MKAQPSWVDKDLYPFTSHFVAIDGNTLHYIDEGKGDILLFVHGTPEWSFGYRQVIQELRSHFRCIAIDLLGFGLSDKPADVDYTCRGHAERLARFINTLSLTGFSFIANDFGGGIALSYAIDHPGNVNRIVLFNTWMRSLRNDPHYSFPARVMNSWLGRYLYLQRNFPVNVVLPAAFANKSLLTGPIHHHYKCALPRGQRHAAYAFARELMEASSWWESYWGRIGELANHPILFFWGMKDKFVPPAELERWKQKIPTAEFVEFHDAGHFVQEEKPLEMARRIREFARVVA